MFPNVLFEPVQKFKAGLAGRLYGGRGGRALEGQVRHLDRAQRGDHVRPDQPSARISAARRTGSPRRTSSSARATAAATTGPESTSKARRRGRWSGRRSSSTRPTARSSSTSRCRFIRSAASGRIPTRSSRCEDALKRAASAASDKSGGRMTLKQVQEGIARLAGLEVDLPGRHPEHATASAPWPCSAPWSSISTRSRSDVRASG